MASRSKSPLRVIPLGGLDGIGKNMTVLECGRDMVLVDAGLMFPNDDQPGIDLVLPDYTYVLEHEDRLRGIVITHGHEDHTGSIPYLLADLNDRVPIYGSKLTLGLVQGKLAEHRLKNVELNEVGDGSHITLGCFEIDFFSMTHSIPAGLGLYVSTPQGTILHTGDFKLDQTPIDGVTPNYQAICRFAEQGIDLLMSDSTNANIPGFTQSEAAVGAALRHIIKNAPGRVFVASFSSHIHRLQQVCDASTAVGRKVVVTGRSMITNTRIARELGYLRIGADDLIDAYDVDNLPDEKVVVLCTGSQGEPLSALARMANGEHKSLSITAKDTVIISATPVPGNEKSVQSIINALSKVGCAIYDKSNTLVHVSGHGSQEELKLMFAMTRPTYFLPVHGEAVHLRAHAELAQQMGVPKENIFVLDNGDTLELRGGKARLGEPVESGIVLVDGTSVGETEPTVLRDRKRMAENGVVSCTVLMDKLSGKVSDVMVTARGVSYSDDDELRDAACAHVRSSVDGAKGGSGAGIDALHKVVRNSLSNFLWNQTRTRPMVLSQIMEA